MNSQNVGINPTGVPPDNSAGLDINYSDKGLLIPRVPLTSTIDATTIPNPAQSLLIYNPGTGGLNPDGFYYNEGTTSSPKWIAMRERYWTLVKDTTTTTNMTSLTINNLNLNLHRFYKIYLKLSNPFCSNFFYNLYFNGDFTNSNYYHNLQQQTSSISYYSGFSPSLIYAGVGANHFLILELTKSTSGRIVVKISGGLETQSCGFNNDSPSALQIWQGFMVYRISPSNLISITLNSGILNAIGAGSSITIYAGNGF